LTLAVIGIYGVLSYAVTQRRQEFGVRLALGAEQADIVRLVLRQGLRLTMAGIAIGLIFALLFIGLVSSLLYQVGARDPLTFVLAPILLLVVAFLACYLPARRATRIDAMAALR
jgi:putative ABC transport system permease protein